MNNAQYILPIEFLAVVAFVFAPPLLLAFAIQTAVFARSGVLARSHLHRVLGGYAGTTIGSLLFGAAIAGLAPGSWTSLLGIRDIFLGNQSWPVMPLAFLAVGITATLITTAVVRSLGAHPTYSGKQGSHE